MTTNNGHPVPPPTPSTAATALELHIARQLTHSLANVGRNFAQVAGQAEGLLKSGHAPLLDVGWWDDCVESVMDELTSCRDVVREHRRHFPEPATNNPPDKCPEGMGTNPDAASGAA